MRIFLWQAPLGVCSAKCKHQSPQSVRLWATSIAWFRERLLDFRFCWIVCIHVVWWRPGGLLHFSKGKTVKIFLASVSSGIHAMWPDAEKRRAWTIAVCIPSTTFFGCYAPPYAGSTPMHHSCCVVCLWVDIWWSFSRVWRRAANKTRWRPLTWRSWSLRVFCGRRRRPTSSTACWQAPGQYCQLIWLSVHTDALIIHCDSFNPLTPTIAIWVQH